MTFIKKFIKNELSNYSRLKRGLIILFTICFATLFTLAIPLIPPVDNVVLKILCIAVSIVVLFIIFLYIVLFLIKFNLPQQRKSKISKKWIVYYAIPCLFVWAIFLLGFYPGIMSPDSIDQWKQMITFKLDDWHPVFHTLTNWAITRIWFSPAAIAIVQILFMAFSISAALYELDKMGTQRKFLLIISILYAFNPINGVLVISLWKDIAFTISLMWMFVLLLKIFNTQGRWLQSRINQLFLCILTIFVSMLRHNGIIPALGTLIVMLFFYNKQWKKIIQVILITLIFLMVIKGPVYDYLQVTKSRSTQSFVNPLMQVSAIVHYNGKITEEEKNIITKILPMEIWKNGYYEFNVLKLTNNKYYNDDNFNKNQKEFVKAWIGMAVRNPIITLNAYLNRIAIVWRISPPKNGYISGNGMIINQNDYKLQTNSKIPFLRTFIIKTVHVSLWDQFNWIFWRPALYIYTILFFGFVIFMKRGFRSLILLVPALSNIAGLMIVTTSPSTRYFYIALLLMPLFISLAFTKPKLIGNE